MQRVRNILILARIANYQELGLPILVIRVSIAERGLLQFILTCITSQIGTLYGPHFSCFQKAIRLGPSWEGRRCGYAGQSSDLRPFESREPHSGKMAN